MGIVIQKNMSEDVLNKTMQLFWTKGYCNVSVDEIIEVTGFNRRAIYEYFGGKHDLFIAMLKRYRQVVAPQFQAPLIHRASTGIKAIEEFFHQFTLLHERGFTCGCFLIATASEIPTHNAEVAEIIKPFITDLRALFFNCLEGVVTNPNVLADFLVANVFGLFTLHRAGASPDMIENQVMMVKKFLLTCASSGA